MDTDTLAHCAYCGAYVDETHTDIWGEPACNPPCDAYRSELARQVDEMREAVRMECPL